MLGTGFPGNGPGLADNMGNRKSGNMGKWRIRKTPRRRLVPFVKLSEH